MKKRIISLLLAIVMVLGMMPVFAMAEEATETTKSVMIDFIAFAQDAATQDFWADLRTHIGNQGGSKSVGTLGTAMTETEIAAYEAMLAYMQKNYCWSIDEANSHITTPSAYQAVLFNDNQTAGKTTTRAAGWGLAYQSGGFDTGRGVNRPSELNLIVNVKEAGYYKVYTDAYYSAANGNLIQQTGLANSNIGCGYADVLVNGVPVVEKYAFSAYTDSPHFDWAQKTMNDQLGYAYLQEGANTITINTVTDYLNGTTKAGRWVMLKSMEFVYEAECSKEHVADKYDTVCDVCGKTIPGTNVVIDFIAFAQDAAKQDFWADLRTHIGNQGGSKSVGTLGDEMTETEIAAYEAMLTYMQENYCWSIDDANSYITTPSAFQAVLFNDNQTAGKTTTRAAGWGLAYLSGGFDSGRGETRPSELNLTVNVKEEGYYKVYTDAYYCASNGNLIQQTGLANSYIGAGYADVLVNGVPVVDGYAFSGQAGSPHVDWANKTVNDQLGYAYLKAGANTITINTVADYLNGTTKQGRWVMLDSMELEFVDGDCHEDHENPTHIAYTSHEDGTHDTACLACGVAFDENVACVAGAPVKEGHVTFTKCACGYQTSRDVEDCYDTNTDGKCDLCGAAVEIPCDHTNTTSETVGNKNGTHTTTVTCECGEVIGEPETADCTEDAGVAGEGVHDTVYSCSVCGDYIRTETADCTNTTSETVSNGDKTHTTTVTCLDCGEVVGKPETADCTEDEGVAGEGVHDTVYHCSVCEGFIRTETAECTDYEFSHYVSNNDKTHMIVETCVACGETKETSEDCSFSEETVKHTTTYTCACGYSNSEQTSECVEDEPEVDGHIVTIKCAICGEVLSTDTTDCVADEPEVDGHTVTTKCAICGEVLRTETTSCVDEEEPAGKCDICGEPVTCEHEETTETITYNGDETHTITVTCDWCGDETSETTGCTDEDNSGKCDVCGGEVACKHTGEVSYVSNGDKTHDVICDDCGNVKTEAVSCTDEDADCICDKCDYDWAVATTEDGRYATLAEAIANANGGTVTLVKDTAEDVTISDSMTLDLDDNTLTTSLRVTAGEVIISNGTIIGNGDAIILGTKDKVEEDVTVTLTADLTVYSATDCAVLLYDGTVNTEATLSAAGGYAVLQGSGNNFGNANITGGSLTHNSDLAIYWPQNGTLNISGGVITGTTAVYVKGGEVNISGGELIATGAAKDFDPYNDGANSTGDALVVENAGGDYGIADVSVTGGTFTSAEGKAVAGYTRDVENKVASFVEGGIFSTDVTELCIEGYACKKNDDDTFTPAEIETFESNGSNMTLGNDLILNVHFLKKDVDGAGRELTAYVTHNGKEIAVELLDYNTNDYAVPFKIAAKQMADEVTVELRDDCGNVYATKVETVAGYAVRTIEKELEAGNVKAATLLVDMVNYGAAAQQHFKYNVENLANAGLTDEMKALATDAVACQNNRVKGDNYVGSFLTLEDKLWLKFVFTGDVKDGYTATLTYTDYRGREQTAEGIIAPFGSYGRMAITTDKLVVADGYQMVTVTVKDANGNPYGSATDSIEGYVARGTDEAIYSSIMKFVTSTKDYLLNR